MSRSDFASYCSEHSEFFLNEQGGERSSGGEEGDWRGRRGDITDTREGGDTIRYIVGTIFIYHAGKEYHPRLLLRSMRGTVRGVKNRVRAGIATFLQDQTAKVSHPTQLFWARIKDIKGMVPLIYKFYLRTVFLCVNFNGTIGFSEKHLFLTCSTF